MKRVILFLLCITLAFSCISCSKNKKEEENTDRRMAVDERLNDMAILKVYAVKDNKFMTDLQNAFTYAMFATKEASMEIEWFESYETLYQTLTTELLGGGGPDVIFFYPSDFESFYSLLKNNIFADLNPYLEECQIPVSRLNEQILEAGVFNEKRMFLPLSYQPDFFYASDAVVNGFSFDNISNMEQFVEKYEEMVRLRSGEVYNFYNTLDLAVFLELVGIQVVDYEKQNIAWDEEELKYYVDLYKKLSANFITDQSIYEEYSNPDTGIINEGDVAFINISYFTVPRMMKISTSYMKALAGKDKANLFSLSDLAGNGTTAFADLCVAVNQNSKHKKQAVDLIRTALDKSMQNRDEIAYPVLNNSLNAQLIDLSTGASFRLWFGIDAPVVPMMEEEVAHYKGLLNNIQNPIWADYRTRKLINDSFEDYLTDKKDWGTTIKKVNSTLRMYLSE